MSDNALDSQQGSAYKCSSCGATHERDRLTVKRALFLGFGRNAKALRSRVVAWLCDDCRATDPDWSRPVSKGGIVTAPGDKDE